MTFSEKIIYKYPIQPGKNTVRTFAGAIPRHVGLDPSGEMCIWLEVRRNMPEADFIVYAAATGQEIRQAYPSFVGSVLADKYMWHVYTESETYPSESDACLELQGEPMAHPFNYVNHVFYVVEETKDGKNVTGNYLMVGEGMHLTNRIHLAKKFSNPTRAKEFMEQHGMSPGFTATPHQFSA